MSKTSEAWDNLIASLIAVPTRIMCKGTSSRVWAVAGTLAYMYFINKFPDMSDQATVILSSFGVVPGAAFIAMKTIENSKKIEKNAGGNTIPKENISKPSEHDLVKPPDAPETSTPVLTPSYGESKVINVQPFNKAEFIRASVKYYTMTYLAGLGKDDPQGRFYSAQAIRNAWLRSGKLDNSIALQGCNEYILNLAYKAFEDIWAISYQKELDKNPEGCMLDDIEQRALAMSGGHYAILMELQEELDNCGLPTLPRKR